MGQGVNMNHAKSPFSIVIILRRLREGRLKKPLPYKCAGAFLRLLQRRLERPTLGLGNRCSILLSYWSFFLTLILQYRPRLSTLLGRDLNRRGPGFIPRRFEQKG